MLMAALFCLRGAALCSSSLSLPLFGHIFVLCVCVDFYCVIVFFTNLRTGERGNNTQRQQTAKWGERVQLGGGVQFKTFQRSVVSE